MDGIPDSVLKQGSKAESLQKALTEPETPAPKVESPPAEPAKPAEPVKTEEPKPKADDFEHKYSVLKGKYDKETRDFRDELARATSIISQMQATLDQQHAWIEARKAEPAKQAAGSEEPLVQGPIDPANYAEYGSEIVELAKTVNALVQENKRLQERPAPVNQDNERLERVEKAVEASAKDRFYADLNAACAEWRDYNRDETFLAWAEEVHPVYRVSRLEALRKAFSDGDANGVAVVFNEYKATLKPASKAKEPTPPKPVMPSEGAGGSPPGNNAGEHLTIMSAKLRQAQSDFLKKRITEAEFDKIAGEYQAALKASK